MLGAAFRTPEEELRREVLQIASTSERVAYVREACYDDPALRDRLLRWVRELDADATPGSKPQAPTLSLDDAESPALNERFRIVREIGEGGFGAVYLAEQLSPIRRRVAVKMLKPGMDTRQVIARFELERQALGMMEHPNIARVFEAGANAAGRPYFVMEYVEGMPITEFCRKKQLPVRERLRLFADVCHAIQHAHQKGIIHRDLKPTNILVCMQDETPLPKVIDFGIAKAMQDDLAGDTLLTREHQLIGTPAYLSPEQAALTSADIDTRTDIYSLGVLLYELLTGTTPFDSKALLESGIDEMRRTIREKDPVPPSTRLKTVEHGKPGAKPTLPKDGSIDRDLDWIVMKCLRKERSERYATANGLGLDVQRYLANEPIAARPPSACYRARKAIRRHKVAAIAASAVLAALVIGLSLSTWQWVEKSRAYARALNAEAAEATLRRQAEQEAEIARREAAKSKQVARFLTDMLDGVGPSVALGRDTKLLRDILERTSARVESELKNQPDVQAELRFTMGIVFEELGEYARSENMYRDALALRKKVYGEEHTIVAQTMNRLAYPVRRQGKVEEAWGLHQEALAMHKKLFGLEHPDTAWSLVECAVHLRAVNKGAEALPLLDQALEIQRRLLGDDHPQVGETWWNIGMTHSEKNEWREAEPSFFESLRIRQRTLGADHPLVAVTRTRLLLALSEQGKFARADELLSGAIPAQGPLSEGERQVLKQRGHLRGRFCHWAEARADLEQALTLDELDHETHHFLAPLLVHTGDVRAYRAHRSRVLALFRQPSDPNAAERLAKDCLMLPIDGADLVGVNRLVDYAISADPRHWAYGYFEHVKALAELRTGNWQAAADWEEQVLRRNGENIERDIQALFVLALAQQHLGKASDARANLAKALALQEKGLRKLSSGDLGHGWVDWIVCDTLAREAKMLIFAKGEGE